MSFSELVEMSNRYGNDGEYVLADGGNTSYKENGVMYVKESGTSLADITAEQFVKMDMAKLSSMLQKKHPVGGAYEAAALEDMMAARLPDEEIKRPSAEAILHAIFPQKFVLHTHPALVNGLSCGKDGGKICGELFGNRAVWVPLTKPGYIPAAVCVGMFEESQKKTGTFPQIVISQNHGIFVAADTLAEIDALMDEVMGKLKSRIIKHPDFCDIEFNADTACAIAPALRMLYACGSGTASAVFCANAQALEFASSEQSMCELMKPFTPDHIVYCKHTPLYISQDDDYRDKFDCYVKAHGFAPKIAAVKGLGFFALGKNKKEADIARLLFLDAMKVAVYARSFGGCNPLPDDFTDFILNREVKNYRQKAALSDNAKRLARKIAIVTGSAQGFGKGIAEALSGAGAYVVVADLNLDGAKVCADELNEANGSGCAIAVESNVAIEASVKKMVQAAVLNFGGLDVLVSNAGIAIAGSLDEMSKEKFELVTAVNYTGYFLCTKHASVPMKLQHEYDPGYVADIIEINSKSGLEGSNKNFAYAGSKFGGVGLTQSFALELVEYGIKVNAICPGNLLDGPLWSDPEKGLFKQYFEAGKVPGAKSVADVRKFYESKVPMKRGCTTGDVAKAIFYVIEQEYETGQAIPVTGGQIMLK